MKPEQIAELRGIADDWYAPGSDMVLVRDSLPELLNAAEEVNKLYQQIETMKHTAQSFVNLAYAADIEKDRLTSEVNQNEIDRFALIQTIEALQGNVAVLFDVVNTTESRNGALREQLAMLANELREVEIESHDWEGKAVAAEAVINAAKEVITLHSNVDPM